MFDDGKPVMWLAMAQDDILVLIDFLHKNRMFVTNCFESMLPSTDLLGETLIYT